MNSMTGYGRATAALGPQTLTVQVSSVNRKGLDLTLSLPDEWQHFEAAVGDAVRKVALRGKVHVAVEVEGPQLGQPRLGPGRHRGRRWSATWPKVARTARRSSLSRRASCCGRSPARSTGTKLPADEATGEDFAEGARHEAFAWPGGHAGQGGRGSCWWIFSGRLESELHGRR